jgi:gas vesicle protein
LRFLLGILIGVAVGIAVGLIIAPQPGSETRRYLRTASEEALQERIRRSPEDRLVNEGKGE